MNRSLLTVQEVSSFLSMHPNTIYKMVEIGEIPHIRLPGSGIRFKKEELDHWLSQRSRKKQQIAELLPKFDLSLDSYDKMFLIRRTELKNQTRWTYGIGSVILRKTKNKEDRFYIDYQIDKHRIRKAVKGASSKTEAVKALNSEVADALQGKYSYKKTSSEVGFREMADLFLTKYSMVNKKSWRSADKVYIRHLKSFYGDSMLSAVTTFMVEEYKSKRLSAGLKNSSVNRELSCLRKIFNVAIDWGKASENPVSKVKFLSESSCIRERVLDEDEEDRLIKEATSFLKPILLVALHTGMRKSEVLNMMWQNIDFTSEEIRIVQSKSGKGRIIPMTSTLMRLLQTLKFQNGNSDYVFVNPLTGKPYVDITKTFSRACRNAEVEDFHFHDLRHTFASRLVRNGYDLNVVKELMGHSSITTTQRYLHSQAKEKKMAVESLAGQARYYPLECQTSVKSAIKDVDIETVIPSVTTNYSGVGEV